VTVVPLAGAGTASAALKVTWMPDSTRPPRRRAATRLG